MANIERRECGRCGAEVREGKRTHFCGELYPLKVTDDIRVVEYVPASHLRGAVSWLSSDEAFEVAWKGAKSCGIGKVSPAQMTAALNALADHLRGR